MTLFRKRVITEIIIAFTIVAALLVGILFFAWNVGKYADEVTLARQELAIRSISLQSLAALRSDYEQKVKPYLNVFYNIVPAKDELINLSEGFQAIASSGRLDYGFTFLGEAPASAEALGSVRFSLKLGGDLNPLLDFLRNLENFRYLVNIENVALTKETSASRMDVRGGVFFR